MHKLLVFLTLLLITLPVMAEEEFVIEDSHLSQDTLATTYGIESSNYSFLEVGNRQLLIKEAKLHKGTIPLYYQKIMGVYVGETRNDWDKKSHGYFKIVDKDIRSKLLDVLKEKYPDKDLWW